MMEQIRTTPVGRQRAGSPGATDAPRIVIIGAGPTGLAAGYRLRELGHTNFVILESRDKVGGLASSETSPNGFIYDIGGHVLFSHPRIGSAPQQRQAGGRRERTEEESPFVGRQADHRAHEEGTEPL